jgi:MFS family permease
MIPYSGTPAARTARRKRSGKLLSGILEKNGFHPSLLISDMHSSATATIPMTARAAARSHTWHIAGYVYFTFICYVSIGLPLAVLPPFVHLRMGYSAVMAGLAISIQYIATLLSRPWAGRISDHLGAKVSVLWGMACCTASGAFLVGAAALHSVHWLSFAILIVSRLVLGIGESLGSTGSTLWGITSAGQEHTAKVIGLNGISTYGGMALAAPLGVILDAQWGLASIGVVTILIGAASFAMAWRKDPVTVEPGEHMPFAHVLGRVAPHGMGLALSGVSYSVLATFVTLFYAHRHWSGAALCLTAFGLAFVAARVLFIRTISHYGGYPVAVASLIVESVGMVFLWQAHAPWMAITGAAIGGLGLSLVFPAIGVEAVKRVPEFNRGTALGVYTAFSDVSFFLVGPIAGAIIGWFGYPSAFLFALVCVMTSLGIVVVLAGRREAAA